MSSPAWPTEQGWPKSTPAACGLDPVPLEELDEDIRSGIFGNIDRVFVAHSGQQVMDIRYVRDYTQIARGKKAYIGFGPGTEPDPAILPDYNYFDPRTHPYFDGRDVHALQSITKSVISALIGIAIGRGEIEGVGAPLLPFLEGFDLDRVDPRLGRATLEDALTMRTGIEWHEQDRPDGPTNSCAQVERSEDWIQFTLDQPMDARPGEKWVYSSGTTQLLAGVLHAATGEHVDAYAQRHLFEPIGIADSYWKKTPTGHPDALGGLYLAAHDLAKFGLLYLRGGSWRDSAGSERRVLDSDWVAASTELRLEQVSRGRGYGYQWWRADRGGLRVWAAMGFASQYMLVLPDLDLVGVVQGWNVFGDDVRPIFGMVLDALIESSRALQ